MFAVPENTVASSALAPSVHPALIARRFARDRAAWAHLLRYDPDERFAVLVDSEPGQEVWLMSWLPGQTTHPHDHGPATGAFTIVSGELTEYVARSGRTHRLVAGQSRVFAPGYAHEVRNEGTDPAVSLHVYRAVRTVNGYGAALPRVS